jgi:hypothetical protein
MAKRLLTLIENYFLFKNFQIINEETEKYLRDCEELEKMRENGDPSKSSYYDGVRNSLIFRKRQLESLSTRFNNF